MTLTHPQRQSKLTAALICLEPLFEDGFRDDPQAFDDLCEARSWLLRVQNKLTQHQKSNIGR